VLKVALTGGIATGKTTVLRRLESRGVPTIDADVLAREVVRPNTPGWTAVRTRFGDAVLSRDGEIDRARLADIVFRDPGARHDLEAIVHPRVYEAITAWFSEQARRPGTAFAVADIPLLYETGHERDFDAVVVTVCSPATQVRRLMARDGLSEPDALRRLAAQWPIEEKRRRADYVVDTEGMLAETGRRVDGIHRQLAARAGSPGADPAPGSYS
jgi:dephospho-CoA kinase